MELVIGKMLTHVCLSFGQDLTVVGVARRVRLVSDDAPEPDSAIATVANVHVAVESCNQRVLLQRTFIVTGLIRMGPSYSYQRKLDVKIRGYFGEKRHQSIFINLQQKM